MTDKILVSRKEIEALFIRAVRGSIFQSELAELLNKAAISQVEPVGQVGESYRDVGGRSASMVWFTPGGDPPNKGTNLYTSPPAD